MLKKILSHWNMYFLGGYREVAWSRRIDIICLLFAEKTYSSTTFVRLSTYVLTIVVVISTITLICKKSVVVIAVKFDWAFRFQQFHIYLIYPMPTEISRSLFFSSFPFFPSINLRANQRVSSKMLPARKKGKTLKPQGDRTTTNCQGRKAAAAESWCFVEDGINSHHILWRANILSGTQPAKR